ncbi:MAG: hypothetical protein EA415_03370 [Sphaerobacteraceae bacterium]|nr:MAG: hypothetical protein EA415_03370 [Sphaerobacteraceae bacterium]
MSNDATSQPEMTCQWCGGTIPENGSACSTCGATRPRDDLVAPGYQPIQDEPAATLPVAESVDATSDDEARARQILKDLNAYEPEDPPVARSSVDGSGGDDLPFILGVLAIATIAGGLLGWFIAPPLLHNLFNEVVGVDTDGPEAFRRLGAFLGGLIGLLFGALLATAMRR